MIAIGAKNIAERALQLIKPQAAALGLEVWDITYKKEGADFYLRVLVDKACGVSIDDCVELTHVISKELDEADIIDQSYILEVSSPGIERELTKKEHFEKYIGAPVTLRSIRPINGARDFAGKLISYDSGMVTIELEDKKLMSISKKETAHVKLDDFDMADFDKEIE
ncbi:MAG: ribosome maturation factor RimP [Clostridiales bacterium]|nr:ribosome maturation factor RimP [Clostridiales bacterium]